MLQVISMFKSLCISIKNTFHPLRSLRSSLLRLPFNVDVSKQRFSRKANVILNDLKVHSFFPEDTTPFSKNEVDSILPLNSLKHVNYEGLYFPKPVLKHQELFYSLF